MKQLLILFTFVMIQSCSIAPFSSNKSAKSYGPGNAQFEIGRANSSHYLKIGYGATPNLDVGYVTEFGGIGTSGLFLKYSMVNNQIGVSHAAELGYGGSESSSYTYIGLISSVAFNEYFELFINPRIVQASTDDKDVELNDAVGNVIVTDEDLTYLYLSSGMNLWFTNTFGLSLYTIYLKGDGLETEEDFSSAATAMFRF
jgi:hypothetical protein